MREDISYIAKGNSKANNKFMECYDISEKSKYNTYLDANNLYGWAMSQYLPNSEFNWLNRKQNISDFRLNSNILVSCMNCLMIVKICYQNFVLILQMKME